MYFSGFGPYIAFGIGGNQKFESGTLGYEQKIAFKNEITESEFFDLENAYFKRFDAGANIFFGYEIPMGVFLQLNAQLGMLKINPDTYLGLPGMRHHTRTQVTVFQ